ncbi:zf-MYND-domain-containing protein [Cubamyces sp. BRFM 1775]|nr:zf-MYND-domain-containing protein [Cubamyces sp. BRFM 1775]
MSSSHPHFQPYHGPNGKPLCAHCKKEESPTVKLKRCTGCAVTMYCSKECQRGDWKAHKYVCTQRHWTEWSIQRLTYTHADCRLGCRSPGPAVEDNLIDPVLLANTGYPACTTLNSSLMDWWEAQSYALSYITIVATHKNGGLDYNLANNRALVLRVQAKAPRSGNPANAFKIVDMTLVSKAEFGREANQAWSEGRREFDRTVEMLRRDLDRTIAGAMPTVVVVVNTGIMSFHHNLVHRRTPDGQLRDAHTRAVFEDVMQMSLGAVNAGLVLRATSKPEVQGEVPDVGVLVWRKKKWDWKLKEDWNWDAAASLGMLPQNGSRSGLQPMAIWDRFYSFIKNAGNA